MRGVRVFSKGAWQRGAQALRKAAWALMLAACSSPTVKGVVWEQGYPAFPAGRVVDTLYGVVMLEVEANTAIWEREVEGMIIRDSSGSLVIMERAGEGWRVVAVTGNRGNFYYQRVGGDGMRYEDYFIYPLRRVVVKKAHR